jgi:hypothetical protein
MENGGTVKMLPGSSVQPLPADLEQGPFLYPYGLGSTQSPSLGSPCPCLLMQLVLAGVTGASSVLPLLSGGGLLAPKPPGRWSSFPWGCDSLSL